MVFQDYALFPWLTVRDNIAFGLNIKGIDSATINQKVDHFANLVGLGAFVESYPHQLSGGMRQRVSIARAFAVDPTVLLMDEPFAALDAQNRAMMQKEMIRILAEESKTVVLVTHSIEESINLSDVIIIMTRRPGRVKEVIRVPEPRRMVEDTPSYLEVRRKIRDLISDEHDLSDVS
jgi:NitT/TauT family transport system ATP-binding protein